MSRRIHVCTITVHTPPSSLTPEQRRRFEEQVMTMMAMMFCELDKGESWTGPRDVQIEIAE